MTILEHAMPAKIKTIPKHLDDELRELGIDLINARPAVVCPFCYEVSKGELETPAIQMETRHQYHCGDCGLVVSLQ